MIRRTINFGKRIKSFLARARQSIIHPPWIKILLAALALALLVSIVVGYVYENNWAGLRDYQDSEGVHRGKKLWDWLELLIVPGVLAGGVFLFNAANQKNEQKRAERENQTEREIAADRIREQALQTYLDRMTELLLKENLRSSGPYDEVRAVARARTLTVLRGLDSVRKATVVGFLYESGLIVAKQKTDSDEIGPVIDLSGADLNGADLHEANLFRASLSGATLSKADLSGAILSGADLRRADLSGATLISALLIGADLRGATLSGATLSSVTLKGATLSGANLSGAILSEAYLSGATVTQEQLNRAASLKGTILPDGTVHD